MKTEGSAAFRLNGIKRLAVAVVFVFFFNGEQREGVVPKTSVQ